MMKEAAEALRVAFGNEKASGHPNPVNVSAVVGVARAHAVKSAAPSSLPCLLCWATGPNIMPENGTTAAAAGDDGGDPTSDVASCSFLSELSTADVVVDLAIVCMKYGSEWAAQQLHATGVARCAVWIAVLPTLVTVRWCARLPRLCAICFGDRSPCAKTHP